MESAERGTLFLDEIGEMPLELQVKLLRLVQQGEIEKVGASPAGVRSMCVLFQQRTAISKP